jgi:hypothetical protein
MTPLSRRLALVVAVLCAACALAAADAARARPDRVGPQMPARYYAGGPAGPPPAAYSEIVLQTSRDGRRVTVLEAGGATSCVEIQSTETPTVSVRSDGSFRASVRVADIWTSTQTSSAGTLVVVGRFTAAALAAGSQALSDADAAAGCAAPASWRAHLQPLYDRFAGQTAQGTSVTFLRSEAPRQVVRDLDFGPLEATCPDGSTASAAATAPGASLPVLRGRFGGTLSTPFGDQLTIDGRFSGSQTASGLVGFAAQDGCGFAGVPWTASLAARGLLGPIPSPG